VHQITNNISVSQTQNGILQQQTSSALHQKLDEFRAFSARNTEQIQSNISGFNGSIRHLQEKNALQDAKLHSGVDTVIRNITCLRADLGQATSELKTQVSTVDTLISGIDRQVRDVARGLSTANDLSREHLTPAALEAIVHKSLRKILEDQKLHDTSLHQEHRGLPRSHVSNMKKPLWKRIVVQRKNRQLSTVFCRIITQTKVVRVETNKSLDDFDLDDVYEIETTLRIHPSHWFLKSGLSLSVVRSGQSWLPNFQFQFRLYCVRPTEAMIFEFCSSGNVDGVKSLIKRKDASHFDTDTEGWTPLHYAAQAQNPALCKLLIHTGALGTTLDYSHTYVDKRNVISSQHVVLTSQTGLSYMQHSK
jgi:hypothetical protein